MSHYLGMMDFGMVGYLDEPMQESLSRLFIALSKSDTERMMDELLSSGVVQGQVNKVALKRDLDHMVICYGDLSAEDLAAARIFNEITSLARRHRLVLPSDLLLMSKVMAISEGLGTRLDPDFKFVPFAGPYFKQFWMRRRSPEQIKERVAEGMLEMAELGLDMPRHLRRLATQVERGELGARVEIKDIDRTMSTLQSMVNRLATSVLVGALIVGLSLSVHMFTPVGVGNYARLFLGLSFAAATVLGIWLLVSLVRSGRG